MTVITRKGYKYAVNSDRAEPETRSIDVLLADWQALQHLHGAAVALGLICLISACLKAFYAQVTVSKATRAVQPPVVGRAA